MRKQGKYTTLWNGVDWKQHYKMHLFKPVNTGTTPTAFPLKPFDLINEATAGKIISIHKPGTSCRRWIVSNRWWWVSNLFRIFGIPESPFLVTGKTRSDLICPISPRVKLFSWYITPIQPKTLTNGQNEYATANGLTLILSLHQCQSLYRKQSAACRTPSTGCHVAIGTDSYSSNWYWMLQKKCKALLNRIHHYQKNRYYNSPPSREQTALNWVWKKETGTRVVLNLKMISSTSNGFCNI